MHIGIIGTGPMALNLANGWLKAGHSIQFGSRQPQARNVVLSEAPGATLAPIVETLETTETVVLAIPFVAVEPFARQYASRLNNKLVIDISNPFKHLPDNRISGPEITAQAIGAGARVVAAFKATFWETLLEPVSPDTDTVRDVFYVGDDRVDKEIVAQLIKDLGFNPVDCGPLRNARILDGMVPLLLELDRRYGSDAHRLSWKLLG
ncbi:MAG: NAD(P)-binding domain-containing protein [Anaerolineaceae bacterium]|nr:MAG: NAD(P)-binding domain-containing protein [Anaerolineaceae bacterium]